MVVVTVETVVVVTVEIVTVGRVIVTVVGITVAVRAAGHAARRAVPGRVSTHVWDAAQTPPWTTITADDRVRKRRRRRGRSVRGGPSNSLTLS